MKKSLLLETDGQLTAHWRQSVRSLEKEHYSYHRGISLQGTSRLEDVGTNK